jgi:hypothetical protein
MHSIVTYAAVRYSQLSKIGSEIRIFNFGTYIRTLYIYLSKDVRTRGYFSKPKGACEQKKFGKDWYRP